MNEVFLWIQQKVAFIAFVQDSVLLCVRCNNAYAYLILGHLWAVLENRGHIVLLNVNDIREALISDIGHWCEHDTADWLK